MILKTLPCGCADGGPREEEEGEKEEGRPVKSSFRPCFIRYMSESMR
jgi:hypothetical protein